MRIKLLIVKYGCQLDACFDWSLKQADEIQVTDKMSCPKKLSPIKNPFKSLNSISRLMCKQFRSLE